ncbi:COP9 signalosome complex subunit 6-like [Histomonas meleagridis]|uniref:COP9 signalosome complex subunit 6-like n=1 Tax=Histomonas meleagridis TaxID=135588 RepID=UPI00355A1137|nr:COP9 signalosome complex subunit 6-like [Histomonas meleagridis]KAH0806691.1 COP9 signalosome complex subunit 6-like [Histomonas meleagridis]
MKTGKLVIKIHPQAIFTISDHATRVSLLEQPLDYPCGLLLGSYEGNLIEVMSAAEIDIHRKEDGQLIIEPDSYKILFNVRNKVFPNEIKIGWFICKEATPEEINEIQQLFDEAEEMETLVRAEFVQDHDQMFRVFVNHGGEFTESDYTYESELGERIAMLALQSEGTSESQIEFTADAFKALDSQLAIIEEYVVKVLSKEIEFNPVLMRKCADLAQWFSNKNKNKERESAEIEEEASLALMCGLVLEAITRTEQRSKFAQNKTN